MESEGRESGESNLIDQEIDFNDVSKMSKEEQESEKSSSESYEKFEKSEKSSPGFCVKEYEQKLTFLEKENFNLKLRLFFLEEKNPNIPKGAEDLYKENIDLKVDFESMQKDLHDKTQLCLEAYTALEMLENEKNIENQQAQAEIDELHQKLLNLQAEYDRLQLKFESSDCNQNDTGFTEFLGMVDKNSEYLKSKAEWKDRENRMNFQINKLEKEKEDLNLKINDLKSNLEAANEKLTESDTKMKELLKSHEEALKDVKEKLVSSQCDLMDAKDKIDDLTQEKSKLVKVMKIKLEELSKEKKKIVSLENQISNFSASDVTSEEAKNLANATLDEYREKLNTIEKEKRTLETTLKDTVQKFQTELKQYKQVIDEQSTQSSELRIQLSDARKQLRNQTAHDLSQKNLQIEHLSNLMKSIQHGRSSSIGAGKSPMKISKMSESLNELQFEQAMQEKKISQDKINSLLTEIAEIANSKTKEHIEKLQKQIAIVNHKQEISDSALKRSTEMCSVTFDHLKELAQFLTVLLGQDSFKSTLDDATVDQLQNVLDKTLEFSTRLSMDTRMSLVDASSLHVLINATRQSIANIKEVKTMNISMQTSTDSRVLELSAKFSKLQDEFSELNIINQQLEDEIVTLKDSLESKQKIIDGKDLNIKKLKDELNEAVKKCENSTEIISKLENKNDNLEKTLQEETVRRIKSSDDAVKFESMSKKLSERLNDIEKDLEVNWIPKVIHEDKIKQLREEIVACEAQIAAVNMDIESKINVIGDLRNENATLENLLKSEDKENVQPARRTLEVSDDRRKLILGESNQENSNSNAVIPATPGVKVEENVSLMRPDLCTQCPVYKAKYLEYKKHLALAIEKLKANDQMRKMQEQLIKGQLQKTQNVLHHVATNMQELSSKKTE